MAAITPASSGSGAVSRYTLGSRSPRRIAATICAAVGGEGEFARDVVELLFLALFFREPDARHLGVAIRHARHVVVLDGVRLLAGDKLRDHDALAAALVRQHRRPGDVADRVIAGGAGL